MHLVLLGAQTEAIDELADLGHTLTVLYTERNLGLVERSADRIALRGFVPSYDCPELAWSALLHLGVADEVDAVIPLHEMAVVSASVLNRLLGLAERIDPRTAMAGRDKAFQKSLWSARGYRPRGSARSRTLRGRSTNSARAWVISGGPSSSNHRPSEGLGW